MVVLPQIEVVRDVASHRMMVVVLPQIKVVLGVASHRMMVVVLPLIEVCGPRCSITSDDGGSVASD